MADTSNTNYTVKLFFDPENIRRISIAHGSTLESFQEKLKSLYPTFYHPELTFQYLDEDGDSISVSSEPEWSEMFHVFSASKLIKLTVIAKNPGKFFKDGPQPEVIGLFRSDGTPVEDALPEHNLFEAAQNALQNLFPQGKILPYNVPSFLEGVVSVKTLDDNTVDFKTDLSRFYEVLTSEACKLMDSPHVKGALEKARNILISQQLLQPNSVITFYNLACVEALTGNVQQAYDWLEKAIQAGYQNISHMMQDPDLAPLREFDEQWNNLIVKLKANLSSEVAAPQESVVQEQPVEPAVVEKPSEPVVEAPSEPVVEVPVQDPNGRWAIELKVLHDMGFLSDSLLVPALEQHGSVEAVLGDLLG